MVGVGSTHNSKGIAMRNLQNRDGSISEYGFKCGYVESFFDHKVVLSACGLGYQVRHAGEIQVFNRLCDARKAYKKEVRIRRKNLWLVNPE